MKLTSKDKQLDQVRERCADAIRKLIGTSAEIRTQSEFSEATGIHNNRISLIMTGQVVPLTWEVCRFAGIPVNHRIIFSPVFVNQVNQHLN